MKLRNYQQTAIDSVISNYHKVILNQVLSLPTGSGKTVIFSFLSKKFLENIAPGKRVLILVHRDELVKQAYDKIIKITTGNTGIEKASRISCRHHSVIIASVQTLKNKERLKKFKPEQFSLIIVDEVHHATSKSYQEIFEYFGVGKQRRDNQSILLVGVTATVKRTDRKSLGETFEKISYHRSLKDMIKEEWLVPIKAYKSEVNINLNVVRRTNGDFNKKQLEEVVNVEKVHEAIYNAYHEFAQHEKRKTLIFCVNIKHAEDTAKYFKENGTNCEFVHGKTKKSDRELILKQFGLEHHRRHAVNLLSNCMLLTEGFDNPLISCIIMARPTQSPVLYQQMIGRGLRLAKDKQDCVIVDLVDNSMKNALITTPSLFGLKNTFDCEGKDVIKTKDELDKKMAEIPYANFNEINSFSELDNMSYQSINVFTEEYPEEIQQHTTYTWFGTPDGNYRLNIGDGDYMTVKETIIGHWEVYYNDVLITNESSLGNAIKRGDKFVKNKKPNSIGLIMTGTKWRKEAASDKQINFMRKLGYKGDVNNITKGSAVQIIERLKIHKQKNKIKK